MKISVTAKEMTGDSLLCPIERAFSREGLDVAVCPAFATFFAGGMCLVSLPLPAEARRFVATWDRLPAKYAAADVQFHLPEPIEFEIEIPKEILDHKP